MSKFVKAEKKKSKLRLGIGGPSGSGKTYSALRLATGLGGKIAVIDTENGSASLYAEKFSFDVLEITSPYTTEKYMEAMDDAANAGYDIIIVDSISHAWAGEGGILQQKEQVDARGGNSFTNWSKFTPKQERFIDHIVSSPLHVICTMRSKQDYIMESNSQGKQSPKKVGLAPVQREGFEYNLTTMFDIAINHDAQTSKDRTGLFVDKIFQITEKTGQELFKWLNNGSDLKSKLTVEQAVSAIQDKIKEEPQDDSIMDVIADMPKKDISPGDYQFTFGINSGKKLRDMPLPALKSWLAWAKQQPQKQVAMVEAIENAEKFLTHQYS